MDEVQQQLTESDVTDNVEQTGDSEGLAVDYEELRYIELRGDDSKLPAHKWGGYNQDFDEAQHVHTHDEIVDYPSDNWGIVDVGERAHQTVSLLIFDIDTYKLPNDFDHSRFTWPADTLITDSQNGGLHVYFALSGYPRGELSEGDFNVDDELPIDIRGSSVSAHVVAPADIPGCDGAYEIANNDPIDTVFSPDAACERFKLDGEQAITYRERPQVDINLDRPEEPPEDMPTCYHAGLSLRMAAPEDHPNTHKVNMLTALCGLAAGYDAETVAAHMCNEYAPMDDGTNLADEEETAYQVRHIKGMLESGRYSPPAPSTLRAYGILGDDEECGGDCSIDAHNPRTPRERGALETVESFISEYAPIDDRPERPDLSDDDVDPEDPSVQEKLTEWPNKIDYDEVAESVVDLSEEDFENHIDELTERVPKTSIQIDMHRRLSQSVKEQGGGIINYEDKLVQVTGSRWLSYETLLNFELDVISLLSIEGEGRMADVEVRPSEPTESEFSLQIEPKVFNDARRFKDEILAKRFSTTIETSMHESDLMDLLRKHISHQDVPNLTGQKQMGLSRNGDEFVTPNGTISADGWTDDPDATYVERDVGAERKFSATEDDHDADGIDNEDVARMIELFSRTRDPERFVPVLGWMYAAPFKPEIVARSGSYNLLVVTGESGVGKTGTLGVASRLLGMSAEPFSCTDTTFATITTLASSRGVPIWLDEYKTSEMADWQTSKLHELLRKTATGGVEQRGRADQSTEEYYLRAPVVIAGETAIRGSAEQRRAIDVTFRDEPTQSDTEEYRRFKNLVGDATTDEDGNVTFPDARYELEEHAVKYYSYVAATEPAEFESVWFTAREYVSKALVEWDVELDDLEVQGLQTIVAGYRMMMSFANSVGADLDKLPSEDDLDDAIRYVADVEGTGRETHIDQFIGLVQRAAVADYVEEDTHYTVVREGKSGEEVRINVPRVFDSVSRYVREHDLSEDLLGSAQDYTSRYKQAEEQESYVMCTSQPSPPVGRAVGIHTGRAEEELDRFDRRVFTESTVGHGGAEIDLDDGNGDDDDPGSDGATPLKNLDADKDYATVTVDVVEWSPTPEKVIEAGGPIESGSVTDETGRRKVIVFSYEGSAEPEGLTHMLDEEAVRIKHAEVTEYNGSPQLVLDGGTTITPIQQGVGYTEGKDPGDGQATIDDAPTSVNNDSDPQCNDEKESHTSGDGELHQNAARADGGDDTSNETEVISEHIDNALKTHIQANEDDDGAERSYVISETVDELDVDTGRIEHRLQALRKRGTVYEPKKDRLRVV